MSVIYIPAGIKCPAEMSITQVRYDIVESSDSTGAQSSRLLGPPRWGVSMRSVGAMAYADAILWETTLLSLDGKVNTLAMHDLVHEYPRGTMRANAALDVSANIGDTSIQLKSCDGGLYAGDWLGVGTGLGTSQLVKVMVTASPDGAGRMTVQFAPPLRSAYSIDTVIVATKPLGYYKQTSNPTWSYRPSRAYEYGAYAVDLLEVFA